MKGRKIRGSTPRRKAAMVAVAAMVTSLAAACSSGNDGEVIINLYGGAAASGFDSIIADCNAEANGRYTIVGNLLPSTADGQREQMVRRLAAGDSSMDLLGMDVVWTAEFAEAGWIHELTPEQVAQANEDTLQATIDSTLWPDKDGNVKQYGIPKHTNVQILWYRKDLVPTPPATWEEMMSMAEQLKAEGKPHEIGLTAAQYEGYVVNVNTFVNGFGGSLVNEDSTKATVTDGDGALQALDLLNTLANSGLTSASLSNDTETEIFAELQNDKSAFSINWPYVGSAMNTANPEMAEKLGFAIYPSFVAGQPVRVTTGGMNYAISKFSEHPDETFEAAMCLRNPAHQLETSLEAGDPPVLESIYQEPEFREGYPMGDVMLEELQTAVPRPISPLYQNISTIISTTLSPPRDINPEASAQELNDQIQNAIDGKGILP
ncbi:MAG: ABC transporter substrate-binding protein [Actinomycetales bacterium]